MNDISLQYHWISTEEKILVDILSHSKFKNVTTIYFLLQTI